MKNIMEAKKPVRNIREMFHFICFIKLPNKIV